MRSAPGTPGQCNHDPIHAWMPVYGCMGTDRYIEDDRCGFLYAASSEDGILKLGGTRKCPWCRVKGRQNRPGNGTGERVRLRLEGYRFSTNWRGTEQILLTTGPYKPNYGQEWFPIDLIDWVLSPDGGGLYSLEDASKIGIGLMTRDN